MKWKKVVNNGGEDKSVVLVEKKWQEIAEVNMMDFNKLLVIYRTGEAFPSNPKDFISRKSWIYTF